MHIFQDSTGRDWVVEIHYTAIKRCRAKAGVDLLGLVNDRFEGLGKLLSDPIALVDVVYVLCEEQAKAANLTDEDFGRLMYGDTIQRATDAFLGELTDFFPDPRDRAGLRKVIEKGRAMADLLVARRDAAIEAFDPAREATRSTGSSGSSPGSSA